MVCSIFDLSPDLEDSVPRTCAKSLTGPVDANTRHTVVVAKKDVKRKIGGTKKGIPDVAVVVIITGEQETTSLGEGNRGDTAQNLVVSVSVDLSVGTDVEETARRVIRTSDEGVAIGEALDGVNVRLVTGEGLDGSLTITVIPQLGGGITGARAEGVVAIPDRDGHNVTVVAVEDSLGGAAIDVPDDAGGVTRRGDDLGVTNEAAARKVTLVLSKLGVSLLLDSGLTSAGDTVDGAEVVKTTTGHEGTGVRVGAGHHPGRTKGDGVHLVGGEGVPDDKLTILGGGHEGHAVLGPVHGVDLTKVTLENTLLIHGKLTLGRLLDVLALGVGGQRLVLVLGGIIATELRHLSGELVDLLLALFDGFGNAHGFCMKG